MSQRRNSVQLTKTALSRLQALVDSGQFESVDDAASHVIVQSLSPQTTVGITPVTPQPAALPASTTSVLPTTPQEKPNALEMLKRASQK